jgi:Ras-related protein Rab-8A
MKNVNDNAEEDVNKILIGNKCDLNEKRSIEKFRGEELAKEYNIQFFETSAKSNQNIEEAFFYIAREIKKVFSFQLNF